MLNTYVLDLENNGNIFIKEIELALKASSIKTDTEYYNDVIYRLYTELINQTMIIMTYDYYQFSNKLITFPDFSYLSDVIELSTEVTKNMLIASFYKFGTSLFFIIRTKINKNDEPCEYLLETVNASYIIINKYSV